MQHAIDFNRRIEAIRILQAEATDAARAGHMELSAILSANSYALIRRLNQ